MLKVIDSQEEGLWKELVSSMPEYDFYHTISYHKMDDTGTAKLLWFEKDDLTILLPCIVREIDNSTYADITSVYGYVGPLCNQKEPPPAALEEFFSDLRDYFSQEQIVSVIIRLHPLFGWQGEIARCCGEVSHLNKTVYIDLNASAEKQRSVYKKSLKHKVNKLKRDGVSVRKASTEDDLRAFIDIYYETMDRVDADKRYYFSEDYFECLLNAKDYDAFILLAEYGNNIVSGALFTVCSQIMQYHLSGTFNDYLKYAPMKLLLDEARKIANELNLSYFHLGGGVGGVDDSLFKFKAEFSDTYRTYKIWKIIIDQEKYDFLVEKRFGGDIPDSNYFPLYRH